MDLQHEAKSHPLVWTDPMVARFWDFISQVPAQQSNYFSRQVGQGVAVVLRHLGALRGLVLDYGCGPGYLLEHLLATDARCHGFDFSPDSVSEVNRRFAGRPNWLGATSSSDSRLPFEEGRFDLIVCLETIEHVLPHRLSDFLGELRRVLKRGTGRLFLTTPFAENLEASSVYCPSCGSVFHRYQHVRSLNRETLPELMARHGFSTELCERTSFDRFQTPLWPGLADLSPRRLARLAWATGCHLVDAFRGSPPGGDLWVRQFFGKGANLCWLGTRSPEEALPSTRPVARAT